jgi:hypothetical protein
MRSELELSVANALGKPTDSMVVDVLIGVRSRSW